MPLNGRSNKSFWGSIFLKCHVLILKIHKMNWRAFHDLVLVNQSIMAFHDNICTQWPSFSSSNVLFSLTSGLWHLLFAPTWNAFPVFPQTPSFRSQHASPLPALVDVKPLCLKLSYNSWLTIRMLLFFSQSVWIIENIHCPFIPKCVSHLHVISSSFWVDRLHLLQHFNSS